MMDIRFGQARADFRQQNFHDPRTGELDPLGQSTFKSLQGIYGVMKQHVPAFKEAPDTVCIRGERYVSPRFPDDPTRDIIGFQVLNDENPLLGSTIGIQDVSRLGWFVVKHMLSAQISSVTRLLELAGTPGEIPVGALDAPPPEAPAITLSDLLKAAQRGL